jgi:hypothetical protein
VKTQDFDLPQFLNGLHTMSEALNGIQEMVNGERQRAIENGYSPTAAEQMAVALYQAVMGKVFQ